MAASCWLACCLLLCAVPGGRVWANAQVTRGQLAGWLAGRVEVGCRCCDDLRAAARPIADDSFSCGGGKHVQEGASEC